jgi:hypothetical protein
MSYPGVNQYDYEMNSYPRDDYSFPGQSNLSTGNIPTNIEVMDKRSILLIFFSLGAIVLAILGMVVYLVVRDVKVRDFADNITTFVDERGQRTKSPKYISDVRDKNSSRRQPERKTRRYPRKVVFNEEVTEKEFDKLEPPSEVEHTPIRPSFLTKLGTDSYIEEEKKDETIEGYGEPCDENPCRDGLICTPSTIYYVPDEAQATMNQDFSDVEIYPLVIDLLQQLDSSIEDIAEYQGKLVIALSTGQIVKYSEEEQDVVTSSKDIEELAVHNGMLYGLSNGTVYNINAKMFKKNVWDWYEISNWPKDINSMEASLDGSEMYLKTDQHGYKINNDRLVEKKSVDDGIFRIYGSTAEEFVVLNEKGEAKLSPSNVTFRDVSTGVLLPNSKFMYLNHENSDLIQRVRQIQGEAVFVSRAICLQPSEEHPIIQL